MHPSPPGWEALMTEAYDGREVVGMDLHRRRSVLVRMTGDGRKLETARITRARRQAAPGRSPGPGSTRRWCWRQRTGGTGRRTRWLRPARRGAPGAPAGRERGSLTGGSRTTSATLLILLTCCGWAGCPRRGSPRIRCASCGSCPATGSYADIGIAAVMPRPGLCRCAGHDAAGDRGWLGVLGIIRGLSAQLFEEGEQAVGWTVAARADTWGRGPVKGPLLERLVGVNVDLGCF